MSKKARLVNVNVLNINDKSICRESKKLKLIKYLRRDLRGKGNVLQFISNSDYYQSLESVFSDKTKFRLIETDLPLLNCYSYKDICASYLPADKILNINL